MNNLLCSVCLDNFSQYLQIWSVTVSSLYVVAYVLLMCQHMTLMAVYVGATTSAEREFLSPLFILDTKDHKMESSTGY